MVDFLSTFYIVIQIIFFLVVLVDLILFLIPHYYKKKLEKIKIDEKIFKEKISILIPARNEEKYIEACLKSVVEAYWPGKKEIIVVDDASNDNTAKIVKKFRGVKLLRNKRHRGKSYSLNRALKASSGKYVATVDADSILERESLIKTFPYLYFFPEVGAVSTINKCENKGRKMGPFINLVAVYYSFINFLRSKLNLAIVVSGPFTFFKREALESVNGFNVKGLAEDVDIAVRLIKKGWKVIYSDETVVSSFWPISFLGFVKQRIRFARGGIHALKQHFFFFTKDKGLRLKLIDLFSLPLLFFSYFQNLVLTIFLAREIVKGYVHYFLSQGVVFNQYVVKFFLGWFSIYGFFDWALKFFTGKVAWDLISFLSILATIITYLFYIYALGKYDTLFYIPTILGFFFMPFFWFITSLIYSFSIIEYILDIPQNKWEKLH